MANNFESLKHNFMNKTKPRPNLKLLYTDKVRSIYPRGKSKHGNYYFEVYFNDRFGEPVRWGLYFNKNNTIPCKVGDEITYEHITYGLNYIINFHNLNLK